VKAILLKIPVFEILEKFRKFNIYVFFIKKGDLKSHNLDNE